MTNTTVFGYEQENNKIQYVITRELMLEDIEKYLVKREVPYHINTSNMSASHIEFFDDKTFECDRSIWRILYMLDGTIVCRKWKSPGEFIYKLKI
jgi:hypothetical protein